MKQNIRQIFFATAALLLMAAINLGVTSCSQDNEEPGGTLPEGRITLVPTVAPVTAWSTADGAADTRADATVSATLTGGDVWIGLFTADDEPKLLGCNYYSVSAEGKLTRLPFNSRPNETEAPLSVDAPGQYVASSEGEVTLTTDGISYRAAVRNEVAVVTIGADGKLSMSFPIESSGLRLNVEHTDGTAYTGADVTATLKNVSQCSGKAFDVKTLTAAAPAGIWGDIGQTSIVNAGDPLLELAVSGGKTYRVLAPRQISFSRSRLYTFNVRVGATGITVSSDDLSIGDFEAQAVTNAEAEPVPLYNGAMPNLLEVPGQTAYWVAPENAMTGVKGSDVNLNTVCPSGWKVPDHAEMKAMTGISSGSSSDASLRAALVAAFGADGNYMTSTDWSGGGYIYYFLELTSRGVRIDYINDTTLMNVRCVRKK